SSFLPSTPPAAFSSSMASNVPLWEDWPNAASFPVREANSPILMVSPDGPAESFLQPETTTAQPTPIAARNTSFFIEMSPQCDPAIDRRLPAGAREANNFLRSSTCFGLQGHVTAFSALWSARQRPNAREQELSIMQPKRRRAAAVHRCGLSSLVLAWPP